MSDNRRPGSVLVTSVVETLYLNYRSMDGFQGVDLGVRRGADGASETPVLRLHLAAGADHDAGPPLPASFEGLPLQVRRVRNVPDMATPDVPSAMHVTGGSACAGQATGAAAAGQVTLMSCDRSDGRAGFITSLAAVGGVAGRRGSAVHLVSPDRSYRDPVGHVTATCCGRAGLAGFVTLEPGQPWLPLERPENLVITSLRRPSLNECLSAASVLTTVEGIGIYRVRTRTGDAIDIDGFRTLQDTPLPSGALVYDAARWSGVGLATATADEDDGVSRTICCELARVMAALHLRGASYDDLMHGGHQHGATAPVARQAATVRRVDAMLGDPRDVAVSGGAVTEDLEPNRRPDIVTVIWPAMRRGLARTGAPQPRGITDRIERLDPTGRARTSIAVALNDSAYFGKLGLRRVDAGDFRACVTYDQVCERVAEIIAAYADLNQP